MRKKRLAKQRARAREVFVPLAHPPGHAQVDFGEAVAVIGGARQKIHFFCLDLPHSDAGFIKAYPAERTEAFCDGHNAAFAFLGGVPQSILYDNTRLAVARILGNGTRCLVKQIVGPVVRRVVYWLSEGQTLGKGERIGMMKFGSRLDVYFPKSDVRVTIRKGDRVRAGETVIAVRLKEEIV